MPLSASNSLQQLIDELYSEMTNPSSAWYGPKLVAGNHYDPYTGIPYNPASKGVGWDFGQMTDANFVSNASGICPSIAIEGSYCRGYQAAATPPNYPTLSLSDVIVSGLSNVTVEQPTLGSDGVTLTTTVNFSQLPPSSGYPTQVTLAGNFSLSVFCCCPPTGSPPRTPCAANAPVDTQTGSGTFSAVMPASSATLVCTINNVNNPGVIPTLTATHFTMTVPNDPNTGGPNIQITINITSCPPNEQASWNTQASKVFNNPLSLTAIMAQLNSQMNQSANLQTLGNILTQQLDAYLRQQGLYPYPASFSQVF